MLSLLRKRLFEAIPTLLVLLAATFFLIRAAPGGPFDSEKRLPVEIEANLRAAYHLDEPLWQQFGRYLWNLAQGDFGPSFQYRDRTVTELIAGGFPVSLQLGALAMLLAVLRRCDARQPGSAAPEPAGRLRHHGGGDDRYLDTELRARATAGTGVRGAGRLAAGRRSQ